MRLPVLSAQCFGIVAGQRHILCSGMIAGHEHGTSDPFHETITPDRQRTTSSTQSNYRRLLRVPKTTPGVNYMSQAPLSAWVIIQAAHCQQLQAKLRDAA
jgi:hypothetical protein